MNKTNLGLEDISQKPSLFRIVFQIEQSGSLFETK